MMKIAVFMAIALSQGVLCQWPSIYEAWYPWMVYSQGMNNVNYQLAKQNAAAYSAVNNAYRDAMHAQYGYLQNSGVTGNLGYAPQQPPQTQPQTPPQTQPQTPPQTQPQTPPQTQPQTPPQTQPETPPPTQPQTPPQTQPQTPPQTQPQTPPQTQPQTPPQNTVDPANNPLAPQTRRRRQAPEMGVTWPDYWAPAQQASLVAWDQWLNYLDTTYKANYHYWEGAQQGNNQYFDSLVNSGQFGLAGRAANAPGATPGQTPGGVPTNIDAGPSPTDTAANAPAGQAFKPLPFVNARK